MIELSVKERDLLQRIDEKEELRPFFFRKVKGVKWFEALHSRGYFNPDQNPKPIAAKEEGYYQIPQWSAIDYLVKTASELSDEKNAEFSGKFLDIVVNATNFAKENDFSNYRTWWQFAQLISQIPHKLITDNHIDLIDYWLDDRFERGLIAEEIGIKWLKQLLESADDHSLQIATRVSGVLFKVNFEERKFGDTVRIDSKFRFDSYHANNIIEKTTRLMGEKLGQVAVVLIDNQLKIILNKRSNDSWSSIWRPAIEDHEQNKHKDDAEGLLISAYRNALDGFMSSKPAEAKNYVKIMMEDESQTIRRLGIYTINKYYSLCTDIIDELLNEEYFRSNYRHEMWHFFEQCYQHFNNGQKQKVLEIVSNIKEADDDGNVLDGSTAYYKTIWLAAIKEHGEEEKRLYDENVAIAKAEPAHPDFASYVSVRSGGRRSPLSAEEFQSNSIDEIVNFLTNYKDSGGYDEPGIEGLVKAFKQSIKNDPLKFHNQLTRFVKLDLAYIYEIVEAFRDLWAEKAKLPWDDIWPQLLAFCKEVTSQGRFWDVASTKRREHFVANRYWIVSGIGRLIESGTKSDDHAFDEKYLGDAEGVITFLLEKEEGEEYKIDGDAVSLSINSPRGHCLEALINLTLRKCRLSDKENNNDHSEIWAHFQSLYDAELKRAYSDKPEYEFATLVTNYLPNFLYMSQDWVTENLGKIFDQNHYQKWLCAIQGYSYVSKVYREIYLYLQEHGDFVKALDDENIKESVGDRIIENIAIAYINDFEKISDQNSLINTLLTRKNSSEIGHLMWFLKTLRLKDEGKLKEKIFELWPEILNLVNLSTTDGKKLASKFCEWTKFIDEINDKNMEWLLKIAPYANEEYNAYELLESLAGISKNQPFEAHTIWMKMLEGDSTDYPEEAFRQIFENLLGKGPEGLRKAKEIVSEYLKKGYERPSIWLKEVQKSYDPS